jgi:hypothetical protein
MDKLNNPVVINTTAGRVLMNSAVVFCIVFSQILYMFYQLVTGYYNPVVIFWWIIVFSVGGHAIAANLWHGFSLARELFSKDKHDG